MAEERSLVEERSLAEEGSLRDISLLSSNSNVVSTSNSNLLNLALANLLGTRNFDLESEKYSYHKNDGRDDWNETKRSDNVGEYNGGRTGLGSGVFGRGSWSTVESRLIAAASISSMKSKNQYQNQNQDQKNRSKGKGKYRGGDKDKEERGKDDIKIRNGNDTMNSKKQDKYFMDDNEMEKEEIKRSKRFEEEQEEEEEEGIGERGRRGGRERGRGREESCNDSLNALEDSFFIQFNNNKECHTKSDRSNINKNQNSYEYINENRNEIENGDKNGNGNGYGNENDNDTYETNDNNNDNNKNDDNNNDDNNNNDNNDNNNNNISNMDLYGNSFLTFDDEVSEGMSTQADISNLSQPSVSFQATLQKRIIELKKRELHSSTSYPYFIFKEEIDDKNERKKNTSSTTMNNNDNNNNNHNNKNINNDNNENYNKNKNVISKKEERIENKNDCKNEVDDDSRASQGAKNIIWESDDDDYLSLSPTDATNKIVFNQLKQQIEVHREENQIENNQTISKLSNARTQLMPQYISYSVPHKNLMDTTGGARRLSSNQFSYGHERIGVRKKSSSLDRLTPLTLPPGSHHGLPPTVPQGLPPNVPFRKEDLKNSNGSPALLSSSSLSSFSSTLSTSLLNPNANLNSNSNSHRFPDRDRNIYNGYDPGDEYGAHGGLGSGKINGSGVGTGTGTRGNTNSSIKLKGDKTKIRIKMNSKNLLQNDVKKELLVSTIPAVHSSVPVRIAFSSVKDLKTEFFS